jgi:hypothetical protein
VAAEIISVLDWYYLAFPKDRWLLKALVAFTYIIETAQTILMTVDCFNMFAKGFGNVDLLFGTHNEWLAVPIFTAIG